MCLQKLRSDVQSDPVSNSPASSPSNSARTISPGAGSSAWREWGWWALVLLAAGAIWLRNRDILSDTFDYSGLIAGAGKIELGLKPYVDFRSPMQSATYALNHLVEVVFGRNYLALTYGGLVLIWGGGTLLFTLWRRTFGPGLAAILAGAVTLGGSAQHTIVFYNPIGLLCLALVIAAMPSWCRSGRFWNRYGFLVFAALILGGVNKINFHALALGMAGLMVFVFAGRYAWPRRRMFGWGGGLLAVGLAAPLGVELLWTGATFSQWFYNVILLAEERVGFVWLILAPKTYFAPTYDMHYFILFKPLHTFGLGVVILTTVLAWRANPDWLRRLGVVILAVAGAAGGVLLTVTNVETITLTSQGTLLAAVAVVASCGLTDHRGARWLLGAAGCMWLIVGGFAAWQGSRVLYGRESIERETFVRLENPPDSLRYLEGVRLDAGLHESLLILARELESIKQRDGDLSRVWFGPAMEWLERSYPESVVPGMPMWYQQGTSLLGEDTSWLVAAMTQKGITDLVLHPAWEGWPIEFAQHLKTEFRALPTGMLRRYEARREPTTEPAPIIELAVREVVIDFLGRTSSTVHLGTTRTVANQGPVFVQSPWGDFWGAPGAWTWRWEEPVRQVHGSFIAVVNEWPSQQEGVELRFRVVADPEGAAQTIWDSGSIRMEPPDREFRAPLQFEALGRPVVFEIMEFGDHDGVVYAGWREIQIRHAGDTPRAEQPPPPLRVKGPSITVTSPAGKTSHRRWMEQPDETAPNLFDWTDQPFEIWTRGPATGGRWSAELEVEPVPDGQGVVPIIMGMFYKSGRLELATQMAPGIDQGTFILEGHVVEPGGWIGVVIRPVEADRPLHSRLRFKRWIAPTP